MVKAFRSEKDIALINEKGYRIKYEDLNQASNYLANVIINNRNNWTSDSCNNDEFTISNYILQ
jgi:hypothetical protein